MRGRWQCACVVRGCWHCVAACSPVRGLGCAPAGRRETCWPKGSAKAVRGQWAGSERSADEQREGDGPCWGAGERGRANVPRHTHAAKCPDQPGSCTAVSQLHRGKCPRQKCPDHLRDEVRRDPGVQRGPAPHPRTCATRKEIVSPVGQPCRSALSSSTATPRLLGCAVPTTGRSPGATNTHHSPCSKHRLSSDVTALHHRRECSPLAQRWWFPVGRGRCFLII